MENNWLALKCDEFQGLERQATQLQHNMSQFSLRTTERGGFLLYFVPNMPIFGWKVCRWCEMSLWRSSVACQIARGCPRGLGEPGWVIKCGFGVFMWCGQCKTDNSWSRSGEKLYVSDAGIMLGCSKN